MSENAPPANEAAEPQMPAEVETRLNLPPAPTRAQLAARRQFRRARKRAQNPLYIPFRWLLLTVAAVIVALLGAVAIVASLRGEAAPPALEPRIEIVTADVVHVPNAVTQVASSDSGVADDPPRVILAAETPASIVLTGPAVPTVIITDTPVPLAVGLQAAVHNVGNDELNVRNVPSLRGSDVLFRAPAGTRFNIIGGPQEADGYSWWQLHDPEYEVIGWAVANYLQTIPESSG
ncbi:MAG: SH3 domain-containing protein [Chloroflexi bacterium]|nr:SH3 domain-containing protein [Chloroflexota bacterium]